MNVQPSRPQHQHPALWRWRVPLYVAWSFALATIVQLIVKGGF